MGFFDRIFKSDRTHLSNDTAVVITERGRNELGERGGDIDGRVLLALETRGSMVVDKIASASGLSSREVEGTLPRLLRQGLVRLVNAPVEDDGTIVGGGL